MSHYQILDKHTMIVIKQLKMFFKTRGRFSVISHLRLRPSMRDDWETSSRFKKHR